jgi:hypothetical protein
MIACPQCQQVNPEGATHCEACFQALPTLKSCPHCGVDVRSDALFCGQCGNAISATPSLPEPVTAPLSATVSEPSSGPSPPISASPISALGTSIQLQSQKAFLFHETTQTSLELPAALSVIHLGKPNDRIPPDIDLSGFPHADIVSRVHADIRVEESQYFLEDTGSANGTYVNHSPITPGSRYLLRPGDRSALGKGDLVIFVFQRED